MEEVTQYPILGISLLSVGLMFISGFFVLLKTIG
jgi:hypothetical protein